MEDAYIGTVELSNMYKQTDPGAAKRAANLATNVTHLPVFQAKPSRTKWFEISETSKYLLNMGRKGANIMPVRCLWLIKTPLGGKFEYIKLLVYFKLGNFNNIFEKSSTEHL